MSRGEAMKKSVVVISPEKQKTKNEKNGRIRVAAYCRVSTESDEQLNSLSVQRKYFEELITSHDDWEYAGIYYDEGITGTSIKKRAGFNSMISDALAGKIDMIIVKSISRFARNTVDSLQTIRTLREKGIKVYFEKEAIDSNDIKSEFMLTIMSSLAQEESQSISENVKWSYRKTFSEGNVRVPYNSFLGYKRGGKYRMVIDAEQAKIVVLIYSLFLEGNTTKVIASMLNALEIATPRSKKKSKWICTTVCSILKNEKYCGNAILQKTYIESFITHKSIKNDGALPKYFVKNDHEAIIPLATWNEVQERLRSKRIRSNITEFSYFFKCESCDLFYGRKSRIHNYYTDIIWNYQCPNKFSQARCDNITLFEKQIPLLCHDAIQQLLIEYSDIRKYLSEIIAKTIDGKRRQSKIIKSLMASTLQAISEYERKSLKVIFSEAIVHKSKSLTFNAINGKSYKVVIPKFSLVKNYKH